MDDADILARTLFGEARGEGVTGQQAVANVVLNRVALSDKHPHFGDGTIAGACKAPWQFSCWNANDPNVSIIENVTDADPIFVQCQHVASDAINGLFTDNTDGATYYKVIGTKAAWSIGKTPCAIIGSHAFYKDIA